VQKPLDLSMSIFLQCCAETPSPRCSSADRHAGRVALNGFTDGWYSDRYVPIGIPCIVTVPATVKSHLLTQIEANWRK
jgi:hypothetical protein